MLYISQFKGEKIKLLLPLEYDLTFTDEWMLYGLFVLQSETYKNDIRARKIHKDRRYNSFLNTLDQYSFLLKLQKHLYHSGKKKFWNGQKDQSIVCLVLNSHSSCAARKKTNCFHLFHTVFPLCQQGKTNRTTICICET